MLIKKSYKGISIMETILAFLIMSLLMTVIYALLAKGLYGLRFSSNKMDTTQTALTFLNRIYRELIISNYAYISIDDTTDPNNPVIAFPCPYDDNSLSHTDDTDGTLLWYKYILYYKNSNKIWKREISMGTAQGTAPGEILEEFYFPDGTGSPQLLTYYKTATHVDIKPDSPAAYFVDSLKFTRNDITRSITIEIEIIDPRNKEKGFKPAREKLVVIPMNN